MCEETGRQGEGETRRFVMHAADTLPVSHLVAILIADAFGVGSDSQQVMVRA